MGVLITPLFWFLLKEYQKRRVLTLFNPELDPLGAGYHLIQSKIAIGSGGFSGKGLFMGTQSRLNFLPEKHTDFIFSVFAEETGFIGVTDSVRPLSLYPSQGIEYCVSCRRSVRSVLGAGNHLFDLTLCSD